ncbi:DUF2125 domain-containing protein [Candidatus Odyssella acanthamoebae]|uniref:Uncharacterized protein n=1 Tax=Candidatus Odyssella acanthamoebae TaxID=91604 RepID=A0A077AWJ6_9PROT|nr:DUF2125 domain-containing protein [Candidatus Paracaedibacter acanthamoebae]AIK96008.1 hypothetical protein ID47_03525 [Candidatus Paracaedibacter acanthamoebae]
MRFVRNLGLLIIIIALSLKLTERYVLQPKLNDFIAQYIQDHRDKVSIQAMVFDKDSLAFSGIKIEGVNDSFSITGSIKPVILGWPGINTKLIPAGSNIWSAKQVEGKVKLGIKSLSTDKALVQGFRLLNAPHFIIPQTLVSFTYDLSTNLVNLSIEIPQVGPSPAAGQIFVTGIINPKDGYSGKLSLRVVNPAAVLSDLAQADVLSKQQFSAINGLIKGMSNSKVEITLPLSLEKGALYLGPIRLYPKSSRDDNFARIGEGVINNLFRSFGKVPL